MSYSPNELCGNVSTGNVLHIKGMGFKAPISSSVEQYKSCPSCGYYGNNRTTGTKRQPNVTPNTPELPLEAKSSEYTLGPVKLQARLYVYDTQKLTLYVRLESNDIHVHDVRIKSDSPQLCRFIKAKPVNEWHAIYNANAVVDVDSWKFDLEVDLVTKNVNPLLNSILNDDSTTDVELVGGDGSVRAHGCIMAAASPLLHETLYGDKTEACDRRIDAPDANVATLQLIKQYAYTGFVDGDPAALMMLLPLASRFQMTSLVRACAASIVDLRPEELIPLFEHLNLIVPEEKEKEKENPQPQLIEMLSRIDNKLEALKNTPETSAGDFDIVN